MMGSENSMGAMPFSLAIRIYWEDTDAGGVVYHASYLCFLERARTEWLRSQGIEQQSMRERDDVVLAVRAMQLDFLKPARLDDVLQVTVVLAERRNASFMVSQEIWRGDDCLMRAKVRIACLKASSFRPRSLPEWFVPVSINGE